MKRVCVLGDSHSACLKLAWEEVRGAHRDVTLTFFADRDLGLRGLQPRDGALVPDSAELRKTIEHTSGGLGVVDLGCYDAVLIVGLRIRAYPRMEGEGHFSAAAVRQWLVDFIPTTIGFDLATKIRRLSRVPIFIMHTPLFASSGAPEVDVGLEAYRSFVGCLREQAFNGLAATVFEQPEETITDGVFTKQEYSIGSRLLEVSGSSANRQHAPSNRGHMNAEYGKVCLATYLPAIASATRSRGPAGDGDDGSGLPNDHQVPPPISAVVVVAHRDGRNFGRAPQSGAQRSPARKGR
jgi:hypothetical protein